MRELLKEKYNELEKLCRLDTSMAYADIAVILREAICNFMEQCSRPAIWCYGMHTKMLMADFMFELKKVRFIIDNGIESGEESGFEIIDESRIVEKQIDGIIISSRIYREEIAAKIKADYGNVKYLDIYAEFEKAGIHLEEDYYKKGHPYSRYCCLNKMQRVLQQEKDNNACQEELKKIIRIYIEIKDFQSAVFYADKLVELSEGTWERTLLKQLRELYELQLEAMSKIDDNNVLMLCVDGLRRKEVCEKYMGNLWRYMKQNMHYYSNAYSMSTSTYESLIPAYSENDDLRTKYYETNMIRNGCRFIDEAKKQKRKIFFYTDSTSYIEDDAIWTAKRLQSAAEKLWDFILDAVDEKNGLFYVHILYESHFSYPNPYTTDEIIAEGTHIFFDYLENNGGRLRTDYGRQQKDSLKYLDDTVVPLIEKLKCRMVLYADHGNVLIDKETKLTDIESTKYTFHEDLIQVPLAVKSPEASVNVDSSLISIKELNNIIIALMNKREILIEKKEYIKVLRSEIYNLDFRYLYKKTNHEHGLLAFEVFIFEDGYKLAVYADGVVELYSAGEDSVVEDVRKKGRLLEIVRDKVTVCDLAQIV